MTRMSPREPLPLVGLALAAVLLGGCPKTPTVGSNGSPTTGGAVAPPAGGPAPLGTLGAGTAPGTPAGAASTPAPGAPAGAGTTLPTLPSPAEFLETPELKDVHFDYDRSEIRPEDRPVLDDVAAWLATNPVTLLLIEGHCDERGTDEYNLALGERRAHAARDYLVAQGVASSRITVVTYGEERPVCTASTETCWARNRRAHFVTRR